MFLNYRSDILGFINPEKSFKSSIETKKLTRKGSHNRSKGSHLRDKGIMGPNGKGMLSYE